jgi:hypothetical protein
MNLLHIGIFNEREPQNGLRSALKRFSDIYAEHDWQLLGKRVNEYIRLQLETNLFDTVFMQIQTENIIDINLVSFFSKKGIRFYNFNGDLRRPLPMWYLGIAPYVTSLFTNTTDVDTLRRHGHNAYYMQIGYDDTIYNPFDPSMQGGEIVFMGNNFKGHFQLSDKRKEVVTALQKRYKRRFEVYGSGWENGGKHTNFRQNTEAAIYRASKFGININHLDAGRYTSDRMFRIMACGTMCLTWKYENIEAEFTDGVHLRTWSDIDELFALIDYYSEHENERAKIASAGCEYVLQKYNWDYRIGRDFLDIHKGAGNGY